MRTNEGNTVFTALNIVETLSSHSFPFPLRRRERVGAVDKTPTDKRSHHVNAVHDFQYMWEMGAQGWCLSFARPLIEEFFPDVPYIDSDNDSDEDSDTGLMLPLVRGDTG